LDRAIEDYYRSLGAAEHREGEEWASLGDEAAHHPTAATALPTT
jgi:hypothetical protein